MEEQWYADRTRLRQLVRDEPYWTNRQLAVATGRSLSWVKKWKRRLAAAPPDDEAVLHSRSRARHAPPPALSPPVVARLLELREQLPARLGRVAGPRTLLYYLHEDEALREAGYRLPRSTSTVHRLLREHGYLSRLTRPTPDPWPPQPPLACWQMDFKDVTSVVPEPGGKQMHVVETLNWVDEGTSLVMGAEVRADFTSETALLACAAQLERRGLPRQITFDRDPRFVGSWSGQDFPTPFVRFWLCLGVKVVICPPRRPDRNAFVERYHRSYKYECLWQHQPATLEAAREVTATYIAFYNHERPNQAASCGNRPPSRALAERPELPPICPPPPAQVDPDTWLRAIHGQSYTRRLSSKGTFQLDGQRYYVQQARARQPVAVQIDALKRQLVVRQGREVLKQIPIRGLYGAPLPWPEFVARLSQEARTHWRKYLYSRRRSA